jgi:hypothetical protein
MGIVISTHLPPPVMIDSTEVLKWVTHINCYLSCRSRVVWGIPVKTAGKNKPATE